MDPWQALLDGPEVDLWTKIENCLSLAHRDHYDELRVRRDRFTELMYLPRLVKCSEVGSDRNGSDKTNASSGVYKAGQEDNEDVEKEPQHMEDTDEDEDEDDEEQGHGQKEEGNEIVQIDSDDEDAEPTAQDVVAQDPFDDDVDALTDHFEREAFIKNEIFDIMNTVDNNYSLPVEEAMDILHRMQELNISVNFLKETKIGKSISRLSRKHPDEAVKEMARGMVRSWKVSIDAAYLEGNLAASAPANDEAGPVAEEEVGLPAPPLDEGGLLAARTVEISEIFNFSESDLSVASGASEGPSGVRHSEMKSSSGSEQEQHLRRERKGVARVLKVDKHPGASEGPSGVSHSERKSSGGSHQEQHLDREGKGVARVLKVDKHPGASEGPSGVSHSERKSSSGAHPEQHLDREGKGVARVLKVDKHRPVHVESRPGQHQRDATHSSGSIRRGPSGPSERMPSQGRSNAATTSATGNSQGLPARPRPQGSQMDHYGRTVNAGRRKLDAVPRPTVGATRPRVETTKPGLATRVEPLPNDINAAIMHSKRQLQQGYASIANAKKQRTVQPLELTDLPKGGPKAQRPGQGWGRTK